MSRGRFRGATRPHANQWGSAWPLRVPKGDDVGRVVGLIRMWRSTDREPHPGHPSVTLGARYGVCDSVGDDVGPSVIVWSGNFGGGWVTAHGVDHAVPLPTIHN